MSVVCSFCFLSGTPSYGSTYSTTSLFIPLLIGICFVSDLLAVMSKTATNIRVQHKCASLLYGHYVLIKGYHVKRLCITLNPSLVVDGSLEYLPVSNSKEQ